MRRKTWTILASVLAIISLAWTLFFFYDRPTTIRIAVTQKSVDHQIVVAAAKLLRRERANIRFKPVVFSDPITSAKALEARAVDLAIVRSDLGQPVNGKALVIMRKSAVLIAAPPGSAIKTVANLRGKRVGILTDKVFRFEDRLLLNTILAQYNVPSNAVRLVPLEIGEISGAVTDKQVDAIFVIGAAGAGPVADVVALVAGDTGGEPVLLSISQSYAIAQASPSIIHSKIVAGSFGGAKPRPVKSIDSVAVTTLLMADTKLEDTVASTITRYMFTLKPKIAISIPEALRMEAPSTSKDASLSVHPGAAAFLDGEDLSLVMRYGDYIYLGALVLSMIGSAIAALFSRAGSLSRRHFDETLTRLMELLGQTRMADSTSMLKIAELEVDSIVASALTQNDGKSLDADLVSALGLAVGQVREAIRDKHAELAREHREKNMPADRLAG